MPNIYFDNSATTMPCTEAISAMVNAMKNVYGNPSSLHKAGAEAAELLLNSRNEILKALHGEKIIPLLPRKSGFKSGKGVGKLIFTASGTEANNLAIFGTLEKCKIKNPRIITTDSEHPSVLEPIEKLKNSGAEVVKVSTRGGKIDISELKTALTPNTVLVSVMYVNNETGAIYNVPEVFKTAKKLLPDVICHTDCVQAFQKISFTPSSLFADMITVSGHKVHAPKGIGALWVKDELIAKGRPLPYLLGGGQEDGFRSGTENIPGIAAFAAAVKANGSDKAYKTFCEKTSALRALITENLPESAKINQPSEAFTPHILSLTLPTKKSQPMLNYLSAEGVYISSGSACSSHKNTVSHVLTSFGLSNDEADRTIRVSIDASNTEEEAKIFCEKLSEGIKKLAK